MVDRLSPQDASFLHFEDERNYMHIGSVAVFEGPPPPHEAFQRMVAGKLPLVPRYRQRVRMVPFDLGRPVWVDDKSFRLDYHVRRTALPRPGGREELRNLASRVMSQMLDRGKPLWEMWVVEGLEDDHWALVSKVHHCMVDGIASSDLLAVILDDSPDPAPPVPDHWRPAPEPSGLRLAGEAVVDYLASPYEQFLTAQRVTRLGREAMEETLRQGMENLRGLASLAGLVRQVPPTTLMGPIGSHRRWSWARIPLEDVKTARRAFGGTVNDVVLSVVAKGFADLLTAHGEPPAERVVRSLVPVSVRRTTDRGVYDNRVSAIFAELPVGVTDPVARLTAVRQQMDRLKRSGQAVAASTLTSLSGFAPPLLLAVGTRVAVTATRRLQPRSIATVTTNVPGPQHALYAVGRRMVEALPYVPIAAPARVGVAIYSYDGWLHFGATGDFDSAPDVEVLTRGIELGMLELVKAAGAEPHMELPPPTGVPPFNEGTRQTP
jgi:diacylglycerol O-acyltransferase / wax synthase